MVHLRRKLGGEGGVLWGTAQSPPPPKGQGLQRGLPVSLPPTAQSTRKEMPTTSSYRAQPQGPPQHLQWGLLPAAPPSHCCSRSGVQPPAQATSLGGGGGILNVGPVVAWEGGEVTPHPVNKRQSLNESTNRSLSAICVWAEGGQRESMQRAEGGGGATPAPPLQHRELLRGAHPPVPPQCPPGWGCSLCHVQGVTWGGARGHSGMEQNRGAGDGPEVPP